MSEHVLRRADVARPVRAQETVPVPELSGSVIVRALLMSDRIDLATTDRPKFSQIAETLARTVVDADGEQLFSVDEWQIFGTKHDTAAYKLFETARRLSGMGGDDTPAPAKKKHRS